MSLWKRFRAWRQRCRTCEVDGIQGEFHNQFPELTPVEPLKFGHLYQCSRCGRYWFQFEQKYRLERIPDGQIELVREWNRKALVVGDSVLPVLAGIGGVENPYRDEISVPCSVRDGSGLHLVRAVVLICKRPPSGWYARHEFRWVDDIASVSASPFALPLEVRRASLRKKEESMGFAPVGVIDSDGKEYTLACMGHFFDHDGVRGESLRLSGRTKKWRNVITPEPAHVFYFADWFEGCEALTKSP